MDQYALLLTNDGHYNIFLLIVEKKQRFKYLLLLWNKYVTTDYKYVLFVIFIMPSFPHS
jgi:hypothetical protein